MLPGALSAKGGSARCDGLLEQLVRRPKAATPVKRPTSLRRPDDKGVQALATCVAVQLTEEGRADATVPLLGSDVEVRHIAERVGARERAGYLFHQAHEHWCQGPPPSLVASGRAEQLAKSVVVGTQVVGRVKD